MRLRRLDLTRYGKFTDHGIDFGEAHAGRPDLHIIYGPNEAGKSTAFAAFLDLLFGIETRSTYNFIHPYPAMRIGAALDIGGATRDVVRIKRPQNSLLDHRDQPVAESSLSGELGGIDRQAYRTMFSLDDETLEKGGESILASKGDLGQLLFSASAGLADLSHGLDGLRTETDGFYKYKARSGALLDLKRRLADLKAERETIDTLASDYARLVGARDGAQRSYDETIASRGAVQARMQDIQRHLGALPRLAAFRDLEERLDPLADLPDAPASWPAELPGLRAEAIELSVKTAAVAQEIERLSASIDAVTIDEPALGVAGRVEALADLRDRFTTADKDLPDRRARLRQADTTLAGLLRRIERDGEPDPHRLLLGASTTGRLRALIESRSGILGASASASTELAAAHRRLADAEAGLQAAAGDPVPETASPSAMVRLYGVVAATRADDHAARRRLAEKARRAAEPVLAERLRALLPWEGDVESLLDLAVPDPGTLGRWRTAMDEAGKAMALHAREIERLTSDLRRLAAERKAIGSMIGPVAAEDAAGLRADRDAAWAAHRATLDGASADRFEAALRRDDAVAASRFGHLADLERLNRTSEALAVTRAAHDREAELQEVATARLRSAEAEAAAAIATLSPALARTALPGFEAWLVRRDAALEARQRLWAAERDLADADADEATLRDRLAAALADVGLARPAGTGLDTLLANAQQALDREAELRGLRDALDERRRDVATRRQEAEDAAAREQAWTADWAAACSACWLGERCAVPDLATVREILPALSDLVPALKERDSLADRVDKMEKDQAAFETEIAAFASELGLDGTQAKTLELARAIDARIRLALDAQARRVAEADTLRGAQARQRALAEQAAIHGRRAAVMTALFAVESLGEVEAKLREGEKRTDLGRQASEAERDVLDALRVVSMDEALRILAAADRDALERERAECQARFDDLDQRCRELFAAYGHAKDRVEAIGGDAKVAEIEEARRTVLLEIEDGALRYLKLRVGTLAADHALRAYRDRHRSTMMDDASRAFHTISRGAYSGLAAQPDKEGETLIAVPAGGGSKEATALSKGTRFQLYLALRVAGYREFARARRPVPFIADDIMETFDDFRAEEAFRLFGEMARVGQVIYLTHHRHLCEIARTVCPGVTIHDLSETKLAS